MDRAQLLLDQVIDDVARFDEVLEWLAGAADRVHELARYYQGPGINDVATVLAADPEAVTPAVGNEDAAWEAHADFDERLRRLLRFVTTELTADLDTPDAAS